MGKIWLWLNTGGTLPEPLAGYMTNASRPNYDNGKQWSRTEVLALVDSVAKAFQSMPAIHHHAAISRHHFQCSLSLGNAPRPSTADL